MSPRQIKIMIHLEPFLQKPDYCGPTALKMRFSLDGIEASIKKIAEIAGTRKKEGTTIDGMIKAGEHFGYEVFAQKNSTLDDLRHYVNNGNPPIVDWFSEDDGHYSLVVGINKRYIYLRDPTLLEIRKMSVQNFLLVWFDFEGEKRKPEYMIPQLMIVYNLKKESQKP